LLPYLRRTLAGKDCASGAMEELGPSHSRLQRSFQCLPTPPYQFMDVEVRAKHFVANSAN
jgi:hypothetical protein